MKKPYLYVWDLNDTFYIVDDTRDWENGKIKHTSVVEGTKPALSAGKAYVGKKGALQSINWSSGYYQPGIQAVALMYQWMRNQAFNLTALNWVRRKDGSWSTEACKLTDWEGIKISGYNASALNQSCYEATSGPTWMLKDDV